MIAFNHCCRCGHEWEDWPIGFAAFHSCPPHAAVNTLEVWDEAQALAREYWHRVAEQQLSESMAVIAREHASR